MKMDFSKDFIMSLIIIAFTVLIAGNYATYLEYKNSINFNLKRLESYETLKLANQSLLSIDEAALQVSTLLLTHDSTIVKDLPRVIISAKLNYAALIQIIDTPAQIQMLIKLTPLFEKKIQFLQSIIAEYNRNNFQQALLIASDPIRINLTKNMIELLIGIKLIEMDELYQAQKNYEIALSKTNHSFFMVNVISVILLLFCFLLLFRKLEGRA
jgi:CHASE3 domain sensor protein